MRLPSWRGSLKMVTHAILSPYGLNLNSYIYIWVWVHILGDPQSQCVQLRNATTITWAEKWNKWFLRMSKGIAAEGRFFEINGVIFCLVSACRYHTREIDVKPDKTKTGECNRSRVSENFWCIPCIVVSINV